MTAKPEGWSAWLRFGSVLLLVLLLTGFSLHVLDTRLLGPSHCGPGQCDQATELLWPLLGLLFGWLVTVVLLVGVATRHRPWR